MTSIATIILGECVSEMSKMPAQSVDLILTDPPYFKVKNEPWDNQWAKPQQFLAWLDTVFAQFQRLLKPNGSLYVFASPQMAARVEILISDRFDVLNSIRWVKESGWHKKQRKEDLRSYLSPWEACIFGQHFNSDQITSGEANYVNASDDLRGFLFEPIRAYLAAERDRAGLTTRRVAEAYQLKSGSRTVTGMAGHWFDKVQWTFPTAENYEWLRGVLGGDFLRREYEDIRREYEDLRREYEDLRRPFSVTAETAHSDVWSFQPVSPYLGKHPCEKPAAMLEHIITASSRPGAVVLDAFNGTGATGLASAKLGRRYIGIEMNPDYVALTHSRLAKASAERDIAMAQIDLFA